MRHFVWAAYACAILAIGVTGPSNNKFAPTVFAAASTPFTGTPLTIPGLIPASDFNNGGEGIAYHDTTAGNRSGLYRQTDVDLEPSTEGGYDVSRIAAGEWLDYSVNVTSAGAYSATFRVAAQGQGGTFHLEMNGQNITGPMTVPDTGGWQMWQSVTRSVTLAAGVQVARVVFDTLSSAAVLGNLSSIRLTKVATAVSTPFSGTPVSLPGRIATENFDNGGEGIAYHDTTAGNTG